MGRSNGPLSSPKVFGIGFHKTGTTSLRVALEELGYRVTGPNGVQDPDIATNLWPMVDDLLGRFDGFQDNPWPLLFRELDARCPGSKFVLTIRSPDSWLASQVRHFGTETTPMREWIYGAGCPVGHEETYLERYTRHNDEVLAYFHDRPQDLLVMDFATGAGWPELCAFLGKPVPSRPFPHANAAEARESRPPSRLSLARRAKRLLGRARGIGSRRSG